MAARAGGCGGAIIFQSQVSFGDLGAPGLWMWERDNFLSQVSFGDLGAPGVLQSHLQFISNRKRRYAVIVFCPRAIEPA
jgi:hypothetical protein